MATASMAVPTMAGVTGSMQSYAVGILAGVGYRMLSGFTGSGIIGGAIAAAVVGATVRGQIGEMIAVNLGFTTGQQGRGQRGRGNRLPGLNGANGGRNGGSRNAAPQGTLVLIGGE